MDPDSLLKLLLALFFVILSSTEFPMFIFPNFFDFLFLEKVLAFYLYPFIEKNDKKII